MSKKIKWNRHVSLGNLVLDFTKLDGTPYSTIVLAGENGSGKTTVLSTLSTFLNLGSIEAFEYMVYHINGIDYKITPSTQHEKFPSIGYHDRVNMLTQQSVAVHTNKTNNFERLQNDTEDIRRYGCVFSKARSGFSTQKVQSTTTKQLDSDCYDDDSKDDFTSIKQLLVDIDSQDNSEWMDISRNHTGETFTSFSARAKLTRFRNAFNGFFDDIKFEKIDTADPQEKRIIFRKYGKMIDIDSMSTGEKQIVFRGTQLLKNSRNLANGIILIDEPELSMHPKWQEKVFDYYRNLFTQTGTQTAQIIIATHSEYVIKSALKDSTDVLVIVLKNDNGIIVPERITAPTVLPTISNAEVNYNAFGVLSTDYHIQLYGYLQQKEGKTSIKSCDDFIASSTHYNAAIHSKASVNPRGGTPYQTLPTYIRNAIDHPDSGNTYTDAELEISIKLLIELCR